MPEIVQMRSWHFSAAEVYRVRFTAQLRRVGDGNYLIREAAFSCLNAGWSVVASISLFFLLQLNLGPIARTPAASRFCPNNAGLALRSRGSRLGHGAIAN